ncbi:MAG TPA: PEP/pyruvate-binding domain-containing protein [Solirubrobacteraceae bacterium]|nr:PEP/pyruvate-binding domain-containing protein [Solirubrobacteraceae bacterium]
MTARRQTVALAEARDESEFGGKAVGLGEAIRAGLPVPDGVALSAALVAALAAGERAAVAELNAVHRSLPGPLAVRSSCVGEDSAAASFAGQHLTRLNVRTLGQLTDAVAAVWRSGCSHSALAYRRKLGLESTPRMGVVVQRLLDPDVSGVLFTRHPVTGADERIIEATWGLGEAVVQGLVAPDRYRLSASGEVLERTPGDKRIAIRPRADGLAATELVAAHRVHALCLDDRRLACLHALARDCENAFRAPSDIEWAFTDAGPQLLQRRAITNDEGRVKAIGSSTGLDGFLRALTSAAGSGRSQR